MFKHVVSALAVSTVLLSGTAFAADKTAPAGQTSTPVASASAGTATTAPAAKSAGVEKKHEKIAHKHHRKHEQTASAKTGATKVPGKSN